MSGSATSPTAPDLEGFTCESLEEVRVRFGDPGFIRGNEVALYAAFLGAPPGDKFLRIYWDHANKPAEFQIVDTQQGEVRRDNDELFDIEKIVEHSYEGLSGQTERTVRVELIHEEGNTRLCARNREITVSPPSGRTGGGGVRGAGFFLFASGTNDEFEFTGTPGSSVTITVDTTVAATAFDPLYAVYSDAGEVGLFRTQDDDFACTFPPPSFSCPMATFTLPADADGKYYVVVRAPFSKADPTRGDYSLTITGAGAPRLIRNDY